MKTPEFIFNTLEAGVWFLFSVTFIVCSFRTKSATRKLGAAAAVAFFIFGISDIIESRTGAWWRPWWLLAMKVLCVLAFMRLHFAYRRVRAAERNPK